MDDRGSGSQRPPDVPAAASLPLSPTQEGLSSTGSVPPPVRPSCPDKTQARWAGSTGVGHTHTHTPHTFSHTHLLQHTHSSKPDGFPSPSLEGSAIPPRCLRQGQELRVLVTLKDRQDPHLDSACAGRGSSAWQHGTLWPPLALHSTPSQDRHSQQPLWRHALLTERGLC